MLVKPRVENYWKTEIETYKADWVRQLCTLWILAVAVVALAGLQPKICGKSHTFSIFEAFKDSQIMLIKPNSNLVTKVGYDITPGIVFANCLLTETKMTEWDKEKFDDFCDILSAEIRSQSEIDTTGIQFWI